MLVISASILSDAPDSPPSSAAKSPPAAGMRGPQDTTAFWKVRAAADENVTGIPPIWG